MVGFDHVSSCSTILVAHAWLSTLRRRGSMASSSYANDYDTVRSSDKDNLETIPIDCPVAH